MLKQFDWAKYKGLEDLIKRNKLESLYQYVDDSLYEPQSLDLDKIFDSAMFAIENKKK